MKTIKPRQVVKTGDIIAIQLTDGRYAFGLQAGSKTAIYSITSEDKDSPPVGHRVFLFATGIYKDVISNPGWPKVGRDIVTHDEVEFISQGYVFNGEFNLYSPFTEGCMTPATKDECVGLEAVAAWDAEQIIERIECSLRGERSDWLKSEPWVPFALDLSDISCFKRISLGEAIK